MSDSTNKTQPLNTSFPLRALVRNYLKSQQPEGITILAECPNTGVKLVGLAASKLPEFFGRFSELTNAEGKLNANAQTYSEAYDGKLITQYRLVGYVSRNGTLQADGLELAFTASCPNLGEDGKTKTNILANIHYTVLRGLCNDLAQLPLYMYDAKGPKPSSYYSAVFRPQSQSFWQASQTIDPATIISSISGLDAFASMPNFEIKSPTNASIGLHSPEEVSAFRAAINALAKDHPNALRSQSNGLRRVDDLGSESYLPWGVVDAKLKPAHYKNSQFFGELVWVLPDSLKAPAWTREDVV